MADNDRYRILRGRSWSGGWIHPGWGMRYVDVRPDGLNTLPLSMIPWQNSPPLSPPYARIWNPTAARGVVSVSSMSDRAS